MKKQNLEIVADSASAGQRLDVFLAAHEDIGSRSRAAKLIGLKLVSGSSSKKLKASTPVEEGDLFQVSFPEDQEVSLDPYDLPLDIAYEDKHLIVVNKPAGIVVHPSAGHPNKTLVNALIHHCDDLSMGFNEERPGIVHRLDKDTSGLLVVAKTDKTQAALAEQFKSRTVTRRYWALVFGSFEEPTGRIESDLKRHPVDRKKYSSGEGGKWSATTYKVLEQMPSGISLLELKLETGRTHQIRVHMSENRHPVLGDDLYGGKTRANGLKSVALRKIIKNMQRIALHAAELGFEHPETGEQIHFKRPWPEDMNSLLKALKLK